MNLVYLYSTMKTVTYGREFYNIWTSFSPRVRFFLALKLMKERKVEKDKTNGRNKVIMRNEFFYKTKWNLQGIWKAARTSTASLSLSYENLITTLIRRLILTAGASNGGIYYPTFFFFVKKPLISECTLNSSSKSAAKSWHYESPYCPLTTDTNSMCIYIHIHIHIYIYI